MTLLKQRHDEQDKTTILGVLEQTRGNVTHAALLLGYTRKGLHMAMRRLGIVRQPHTAYLSTQVRNTLRESVESVSHESITPVVAKGSEVDLAAFLADEDDGTQDA